MKKQCQPYCHSVKIWFSMSRLMSCISDPTVRWWIFLKSSSPYRQAAAEPELLMMKGFQPELLRLFEDVLSNGSSLRVRVTGRSMAPFLRGGETLTLRQEQSLSLRKGDLILFRSAYDLPVVHSIIKKRKTDDGTLCFLTKGDAQIAFDKEIHENSVLGKVWLVERPLPSGKTKHIDMNSLFYRSRNFLIALLG